MLMHEALARLRIPGEYTISLEDVLDSEMPSGSISDKKDNYSSLDIQGAKSTENIGEGDSSYSEKY